MSDNDDWDEEFGVDTKHITLSIPPTSASVRNIPFLSAPKVSKIEDNGHTSPVVLRHGGSSSSGSQSPRLSLSKIQQEQLQQQQQQQQPQQQSQQQPQQQQQQ